MPNMAHLPRFRRRKEVPAGPPLITNGLPGPSTASASNSSTDPNGKITPPPGDLAPLPVPESPLRPFGGKLSPFSRVFHRSQKRARDSPPASMPHSPLAAPAQPTSGSVDGRPVSPLSLKMDTTGLPAAEGGKGELLQAPQQGQGQQLSGKSSSTSLQVPKQVKMPAFLETSDVDIEFKFGELVWLERMRIQQGIENESSSNFSPDFRWARVKGPHLRRLDRYMNIQPWHNHRIKLQVPEGKLDYVNASPIVLHPFPINGQQREPDRYIAMQGPKYNSVDHVWRMIVEQVESPGVIVMLTETHDGHMEKCFPYFPQSKEDPPLEINERDEFGDGFRATVRCDGIEETPAGDAIELRKLVITVHSRGSRQPRKKSRSPARLFTNGRDKTPEPTSAATEPERDADMDIKMKSPVSIPTNSSSTLDVPVEDESSTATPSPTDETTPTVAEEKVLWHFLYKKWPDFGVPLLEDLDSFFALMQLSREKNAGPHNPRIVHCSAGVGRSGTFIALEHLMRELDAGVLENYDEMIAAMKSRRGSQIQTPINTTITREGGEWDRDQEGSLPGVVGDEAGGRGGVLMYGEDLIFETVNQLREQRKMMVQAEGQYLFIYEVLRKLWGERYGWDKVGVRGGEVEEEGEEEEGKRDDHREGEPAKKRVEVEFEKSDGGGGRGDPFA
ncbi:protein-tyrosine phosphatase-like protein [Triangularia verruculosa]|uniref:Protein-tyrosine phosphatase-like protein n=1 Tax=Triangularia verruculosa TaxID=2587418 RepID=A0AAN6XDK5_9PEZI|nr:protein-tyrosine phosphatase-like protein [Triangularia verruculosa]